MFALCFYLKIRNQKNGKSTFIDVNEHYDVHTFDSIRCNSVKGDKVDKTKGGNFDFAKKLPIVT